MRPFGTGRRPHAALAAASLLALTAACAGSARLSSSTTSASSTSSSLTSTVTHTLPAARTARGRTPGSTPTTADVATSQPGSDPNTLTMAFGGDVHFEEYLAPLARDPHGLDELRSSLGTADLAMVNLETALTERGTKIGKEFHFRAPASALTTLANAGVDVVTMANNHGVDYGPVGLQDTLAAKRSSPVPVVGIGADEQEAFTPAVLHAKGLAVAVFGASQVVEMTLARYSAGPGKAGIASSTPVTRLRAAVARAAARYDLVVVYLHWGTDYQQCPDPLSVTTAQALEQAGADIVVGGHSHRVNGAGWLGRSYVDYGFGNFVWWRSHEPDSRSGVLTLSVDVARAKGPSRSAGPAVRAARWAPMLVGADGIPRQPGPADQARLLSAWTASRACAGLAGDPE